MQIVLHDIDYSKAFSILTSLVTNCSYSHASILQNGIIYDTTFTRGYFDAAHPLNQQGSREITVIDIPEIDATEFIKSYMGTKYARLGLILWPFNVNFAGKDYCFQAIEKCLRYNGVEINPKHTHIDGEMIFDYFDKLGYKSYRVRSDMVNYSWFSK